jgi:two-component system sensor histidine kinase GlrK
VDAIAVLALVVTIGAVAAYFAIRAARVQRRNDRLEEQIVEVEKMKKNFISHVSHELKAPLASMQETTHLLLEQIPGPLTEKQRRLLDLNLQSGKRLAQMIGNILDLSRLEAGTVGYDMQHCDIAELMHHTILELNSQARERSLRILTEIQPDPVLVNCDPNRMVQLFTNLLENAIRFSKKGGAVGVRVKIVQQLPSMPKPLPAASNSGAGFALIAISDSGPGIDDAQKETVFSKFHQAKQGKKSHGESLGLGLAISRALVTAHHGEIWVENNRPEGAVFFVALPAVAGERLTHSPSTSRTPSGPQSHGRLPDRSTEYGSILPTNDRR